MDKTKFRIGNIVKVKAKFEDNSNKDKTYYIIDLQQNAAKIVWVSGNKKLPSFWILLTCLQIVKNGKSKQT